MARMLSIPVNIVKQATISASCEIPIITATQLNREAYRKEKDKEFGIETVSESIQKVFIADFGAIIQRAESPENGSNGDQPPKPVKATLKVEKNRDGKTGKTNLYFDYPRSRILTNDEYMNEFGEVIEDLATPDIMMNEKLGHRELNAFGFGTKI